jgi:hypothetical protein
MITQDQIKIGAGFRLDNGEGCVFTVVAMDEYEDGTPRVGTRVNGVGEIYRDTLDECVAFLNDENAIAWDQEPIESAYEVSNE